MVSAVRSQTLPRSRNRSAGPLLAALCAADFLVVLDGLIVAVALPTIQRDLDVSTASLQWLINAYVLCFAGFLILGGRLGDLYGRRRILLVGLGLFAAGALTAGLAPATAVLVAARAVQGLGAAMMTPTALALLVANFAEGCSRTRALGWWSAAGSIGIPAGALLGGVLTATWGWRWVLLVNAPAAVLAAVGTRLAVPESRNPTGRQRLDVAGAVLVTTGLALLIFAIVQLEQLTEEPGTVWPVLTSLAAGMMLLAAFAVVERRTWDPLVPPGILRTSGLLPANLVGATLPVGLGAVLFLATLYLQRVLGYTPLATGLAYLAVALPVIAASPAASWLATRLGRRPVAVFGLLLQTAGLLLLAGAPTDGAFLTDVLPGFVFVGAGAPIAFVPATAAAMAVRTDSGVASGIFNTAQQVGNALALAALATAAAVSTGVLLDGGVGHDAALAGGYQTGFLVAAALTVAGALAALNLPRDNTGQCPD